MECRQKGHPQHLEDKDGRVEGESLKDRVRGVQRGSIHGSEPAPKVAPSPLDSTDDHKDTHTLTGYYNVCKQVSEWVCASVVARLAVAGGNTERDVAITFSVSVAQVPRHHCQQNR